MKLSTKLAQSLFAATIALSATAAANAQVVPLTTYVDGMMQQTSSAASQDVRFGAMQAVANTTHQFSLNDQPSLIPSVNFIDVAQLQRDIRRETALNTALETALNNDKSE
jgi:hypothetical protein